MLSIRYKETHETKKGHVHYHGRILDRVGWLCIAFPAFIQTFSIRFILVRVTEVIHLYFRKVQKNFLRFIKLSILAVRVTARCITVGILGTNRGLDASPLRILCLIKMMFSFILKIVCLNKTSVQWILHVAVWSRSYVARSLCYDL